MMIAITIIQIDHFPEHRYVRFPDISSRAGKDSSIDKFKSGGAKKQCKASKKIYCTHFLSSEDKTVFPDFFLFSLTFQ